MFVAKKFFYRLDADLQIILWQMCVSLMMIAL